MPPRSPVVPPQPGLRHRLSVLARFPVGLAVTAARYLAWSKKVVRTEEPGDATDLPPELPAAYLDEHVKITDDGSGPLFHRLFRVHVRDTGSDAADLIGQVVVDLDRAAPPEVVSFRKQRGRLGYLELGDEYRVRMPAPWDGPVRVIDRTPTTFRFVTLSGHIEAGQIEFRALDGDGDMTFEIETWSRAGDRVADLVFDRLRIGKEIQLHMWSHFCLSVVDFSGGRREGPVTAHTRRLPWQDRPR